MNVKLTGVTIEFEGTSAGFTISGSSVLKMIGTATKPIILKGQNAVKGNWKGIVLESADPNRSLGICNYL